MSGFRYFGITVISRAHSLNTFDIVERGMNLGILLMLRLLRYGRKRWMLLLMPLSASGRYLSVVSVWEWYLAINMKLVTELMNLKWSRCPFRTGASAASQIFTMSLYSAPVHCFMQVSLSPNWRILEKRGIMENHSSIRSKPFSWP